MTTRRTKAQWQQLVSLQQSSGLTQKAFCEQEGLSLATFGYWRRKLRKEAQAEDATACVSVEPAASLDRWLELASPVVGPDRPWRIELDLGNGVCLRLTQA